MTLERIVVAVWQERSLTGAAARLGVSLATVSRRLAELERELGVVLFERTTRSLRPTVAGEALAMHLERGLAEIDAAYRRVHDAQAEVSGVVRVSVPPSLSALFAQVLVSFRVAHPRVRVYLHATERRAVYALEDVDVLVRVGALETQDLVARELMRSRHILCARPSWADQLTHPEQLTGAPLLRWGYGPRVAEAWLTHGEQRWPLPTSPELVANDYALIAQMLVREDAVGELPALVARDWIAQGRLQHVLPAWRMPQVTLSVLYAPRLLPRTVRVFLEHLQAAFARLAQEMEPEWV